MQVSPINDRYGVCLYMYTCMYWDLVFLPFHVVRYPGPVRIIRRVLDEMMSV